MTSITYIPSGSMCLACVHKTRNCSHLPFASMPPMRDDGKGIVVIKCVEFEREKPVVK